MCQAERITLRPLSLRHRHRAASVVKSTPSFGTPLLLGLLKDHGCIMMDPQASCSQNSRLFTSFVANASADILSKRLLEECFQHEKFIWCGNSRRRVSCLIGFGMGASRRCRPL